MPWCLWSLAKPTMLLVVQEITPFQGCTFKLCISHTEVLCRYMRTSRQRPKPLPNSVWGLDNTKLPIQAG